MRSLVEEHTDALVGELVAKAVFVGVVHPFCHPQEGLGLGQRGGVSRGCKEQKKMSRQETEGKKVKSNKCPWRVQVEL